MQLVRSEPRLSGIAALGPVLLAIMCLTFTSCRMSHRPERRTDTDLSQGWQKPNNIFRQASYGPTRGTIPEIKDAEFVDDDELCLTCHKAYTESFAHNVHRTEKCEACHGPASQHVKTRGTEPGLIYSFKTLPKEVRSELCMKCHQDNQCAPGTQFQYTKHAACGVACTDCHRGHYNVPVGTPATTEPDLSMLDLQGNLIRQVSFNAEEAAKQPSLRGTSQNLGAVAPDVCFRCHTDMQVYREIAGPHQICGPNGFNCTTCHDAHGILRDSSRKDLCLQCHGNGSPTMAWHSSTHDLMGVACTDCHNPHPRTGVQKHMDTTGVNFTHTHLTRLDKRVMSVQDPETCFKCHPQIFGLTHLPSHHPIREGKMFCSDCHDAHGQREGNLLAEHINLLCWKCHAEKQGPFAYEHPPVTENCGYCHNPHGTVANNLLHQPTTFLCLRCHVGHRDGNHGSGTRLDIDDIPQIRPALYTDCTACHSQIHGSDLPSPHFPGMFR